MGAVLLVVLVVEVTFAILGGLPASLILLVLFALLNASYLPFLNSFYADGTFFIALVGTVFWFAWIGGTLPRPGPSSVLPVVALALLGGAAKVQYSVLPSLILLALSIAFLFGERELRARSTLVLGLVLLLLAIALPAWFVLGSGPNFPQVNRYHAIYGGILRLSSNPEQTLRSLDVPKEFWELPRKDVFSGGIAPDHPVHEALARISRWQLAREYFRDPGATGRALGKVLDELSAPKSHKRGTTERRPDGHADRPQFLGVTRLRSEILSWQPRVIWILFALTTIASLSHSLKKRVLSVAFPMIFLILWLTSGTVVVLLGDGLVSLRQHLIGVRLSVDLLVALEVYYGGRLLVSLARRQPRSEPGAQAQGRGSVAKLS